MSIKKSLGYTDVWKRMEEQIDYEKLDEIVEKAGEEPEGEVFCPRCGSHRLYYFVGGRGGWIYECKDCGYHGSIVIEDSQIAVELREKWKQNLKDKRENTRAQE